MFTRFSLVVALATSCVATGLTAETQQISLVEGGFFPIITYVQPGDTVIFLNDSDVSATVQAADQTWGTGTLGINQTFSLTVEEATSLLFSYVSDAEKAGSLSFDPPPLQDADGGDAEGASN